MRPLGEPHRQPCPSARCAGRAQTSTLISALISGAANDRAPHAAAANCVLSTPWTAGSLTRPAGMRRSAQGTVTPVWHAGRMRIDCEECIAAGTDACDDCVVSLIVSREPGDALVVDAEEERALRALGDNGLVPRLRHRPRRVG